MKIFNLILAILFVLFAYWQINDPDPWLWVSIYGLVAIISGAAFFEKRNVYIVYAGMFVCILGIGFLFPDLINWVQMGTPNIAESMKTDKPHIELMREFFGLGISLAVLVYHLFQIRKINAAKA